MPLFTSVRPAVPNSAALNDRIGTTEKQLWLSDRFAGHLIGSEPILPPTIIKPRGLFATDHVLTEDSVVSLFVLAHVATPRLDLRDDQWTVTDRRHNLSASFSHMVRVAALPQVLTAAYPMQALATDTSRSASSL